MYTRSYKTRLTTLRVYQSCSFPCNIFVSFDLTSAKTQISFSLFIVYDRDKRFYPSWPPRSLFNRSHLYMAVCKLCLCTMWCRFPAPVALSLSLSLSLFLFFSFFCSASMRNARLALAFSNGNRLLASSDEFLGAGPRDSEMFRRRGETTWPVACYDLESSMKTTRRPTTSTTRHDGTNDNVAFAFTVINLPKRTAWYSSSTVTRFICTLTWHNKQPERHCLPMKVDIEYVKYVDIMTLRYIEENVEKQLVVPWLSHIRFRHLFRNNYRRNGPAGWTRRMLALVAVVSHRGRKIRTLNQGCWGRNSFAGKRERRKELFKRLSLEWIHTWLESVTLLSRNMYPVRRMNSGSWYSCLIARNRAETNAWPRRPSRKTAVISGSGYRVIVQPWSIKLATNSASISLMKIIFIF